MENIYKKNEWIGLFGTDLIINQIVQNIIV